jgi:hypothetical protein
MAIHRDDLEAKLREIEAIVDETKEQARSTGTAIVVIVVVAVFVSWLLGRRKGKKIGGARVEVYRLS